MRAAEEASSSGFAIKGDAVRPRGGRPCRFLRSEDGRHCRLLRSEDGRSGASSASSPRGYDGTLAIDDAAPEGYGGTAIN